MENPTKKYFRLGPGMKVRLKHAYIVECTSFKKDDQGNVVEVHCNYIPESKSGNDTSGINVKGTLHWVSVPHSFECELRLYDRLFLPEDPNSAEGDFKDHLNPNSLVVIHKAFAEPSLKGAGTGDKFQFMRKGYFCVDLDSTSDKYIFNRTVTLKDSWAKEQVKEIK